MEVWTSWSRKRCKWVEEIYRVVLDVPLCVTEDERSSRVQTEIPIIWILGYTTVAQIENFLKHYLSHRRIIGII